MQRTSASLALACLLATLFAGVAVAQVQLGGELHGSASGDYSGYSVAMNDLGDIVAIGSPYGSSTAGYVRVYQYSNGFINQLGSDIVGAASGIYSGSKVSLSASGETLAVSAPYGSASAGSVRIYTFDPSGPGNWVLKGSEIVGEAADDFFGYSLSLSPDGNFVAVGAIHNDDGGSNAGHVRVLSFDASGTGDWVPMGADIDGSIADENLASAVSLSLSGEIVAVGAMNSDINGNNAGLVRIFQYAAGSNEWQQMGADILGAAANDRTGSSLSLSPDGDTLAVGSLGNGGNVQVYRYDTGLNDWAAFGTDIPAETSGDGTGTSVDMNAAGNIVVIGATYTTGARGATRVYQYATGQWIKRGSDIEGTADGDYSGWAVAINAEGDTVVSTAPYADTATGGADSGRTLLHSVPTAPSTLTSPLAIGFPLTGTSDERLGTSVALNAAGNIVAAGGLGLVNVYEYTGGIWQPAGDPISGDSGGLFGHAVALDGAGEVLVVGAPSELSETGIVRVFERSADGASWVQRGADIVGEAAGDKSGQSVSISHAGDVVAIGAPNHGGGGTQNGHVRVYTYTAGEWVQMGADIDSEGSNDQAGYSVSLSASGNTVAIGAPYNDGVAGGNSGHARVYTFVSGGWVQLGGDIDGEAANDYSGTAVSLSDTGDVVAVGAMYNTGTGGYPGHVRVYKLSSGVWQQLGGDIDGETATSYSGTAVSLSGSGDIVAIGEPYNGAVTTNAGATRTYQYSSTAKEWEQLAESVYGEEWGDQSGVAVALNTNGSVLAVGSPYHSAIAPGDNGGYVRVFELSPLETSSISGDPHFVGFRGQRFEFQGEDGGVYNLISGSEVQVNGRFIANSQWGDARTFVDAVGVQDLQSRLSVECLNGTLATVFNGRRIRSGVAVEDHLSVAVEGARTVIHTPVCDVIISRAKNRWTDCYINTDVALTPGASTYNLHGLIGQTARLASNPADSQLAGPGKYEDGAFAIQGEAEDYRIGEHHLFGNSFRFNRFRTPA